MCEGIFFATSFFSAAGKQSIIGHCKYLFVSRSKDANVTGQICKTTLSNVWSSAATCVRMDGSFKYQLTINSSLSLSVKGCWKAVSI